MNKGSRLLLQVGSRIVDGTLDYRIPISGATVEDAANVVHRLELITALYKSAVLGLVNQFNDNLPLDRRIDKHIRSFIGAVDEVSAELEGAIENAVG